MERQRLWWALAAAFLLLAVPWAAHSASITVDGTNCTLAEAITSANNNNAAGNGCVNGSGADTITLQVDVTLAADLPQITSTITIEGGGHFISGNNARRVLYVASSGNLTLNEATVKDGRVSSYSYYYYSSSSYGGGIYNSGTVTLTNSTVSGNIAYSYAYDTCSCPGMESFPSACCPFLSAASSSYGGGIYNAAGTLTLTNSTISGNTVSSYAGTDSPSSMYGSLYSSSSSYGGGIYNAAGTLTLTNSTVSGNTANADALIHLDSMGSGIYNSGGTITLRSSIISGNTWSVWGGNAGYGHEVDNNGSTVTTASFNVFGHSGETSAEAFSGFTPSGSDINATSNGGTPTALAAILSPLADNGGPTKTHALPAGSPAIDLDAGCSAGLTMDQRGYNRPINFKCDAGAVEYSPSFSLASGNGRDLPARTWRMTTVPCTSVPSGIGSQYGSDIPGGTYGINWVSYKWNTATQSYGRAQAATDALVQGTGNWLYSTVPATLTVTGTATPTVPCSNYGSGLSGNCFAINLTPSSTARWQIVGHPFPYNVSWADVRVATYNGSAWTQRTPSQAAAASIMAKEMQRWNGSSYQPKDDNVAGGMLGTLLPQEAVWVRMLTGSSAFSSGNIKLLVPAR